VHRRFTPGAASAAADSVARRAAVPGHPVNTQFASATLERSGARTELEASRVLGSAAKLRREVAAADPCSVGPLYERYARLVHGRALAILRSREEAEDLTQEVFMTLCGPTAYDPSRGSMSAFLTAMTRSRAIDRLRGGRRSFRLLESWREARPAPPAPPIPWEHVSMRRTAERVRAALAELPSVQRQVLELAYYRGLSQREIARELDAPLGTVKSWSRRALLTLGHALEDLAA
jgi:RNA polymerase sigma-70 factor, ECF subfamily